MREIMNNSNQQLDYTAKNMRRLLEAYKNNDIPEVEKRILFKAIQACMEIRLEPAEKRYFEVIVNRYLLRKPLMLHEIAEVYNIKPEAISGWEIAKGFELLASAITRMKTEENLRKWLSNLEKNMPARKKAYKLWLVSGKTLTAIQIGKSLGVTNKLITNWKSKDCWVNTSESYNI